MRGLIFLKLNFDLNILREQPLSAAEKQVLSEYFQLEGRRQFETYKTLENPFNRGRIGLFSALNFDFGLLEELAEKQLTLELSCRDHWIELMKSIHRGFYETSPHFYELVFWTSLSLEKHAIVKIAGGKEEYRHLLREMQNRQLPLIPRLDERLVKKLNREIQLFYDLLDVPGLNTSLIRI